MPRIRIIAAIAALAAAAFAAAAFAAAIAPAAAQSYPTRPITMVVPFTAGSGVDVIARLLVPRMAEVLGQQVVIENLGGAGGMIGASRVAKAAPDGYQMVFGTVGTHAHNQTLYKNPLYNAATDFTPVGLIGASSLALITRKDFPADNLQEFIAYARANQAKLQYGSPGIASANQIACVLLNSTIGINVAHVPYRGGAQALQDVIGGRIDYMCVSTSIALAQIESKSVKVLAIVTKERSTRLPGLPTAHEQGLTNFEADGWTALFLPPGAPATIVKKLNEAAVATMNTPAVNAAMENIGITLVAPERRSPEYLEKFVVSETEKWGAVIRAAGVTAAE